MSRLFVSTLILLVCSTVASAQTAFFAQLKGNQETPPNASANTGTGLFYFDATASTLTYDITITGLTGTFSAAHVHTGAPGVAGGVLFALAGGPTHFAGSSALTATDVSNLKAGLLYANVHSSTFPSGEIRGQISPSISQLFCVVNAVKETPPNGSAGVGTGLITVNANNTVTYSITYSGLTGPPNLAHFHDGISGVSGPIVVSLNLTSPGVISGTTAALSGANIEKIRTGRMYVNIHTGAFPNGEVRGQTVPSYTSYGAGCNSSLATPATLAGTGIPTSGQVVSIDVSTGLPGGSGLLFVGFSATDVNLGLGCHLFMSPSPVLVLSMPPLDGAGAVSVPVTLPPATPPSFLQLQYVGIDGGVPTGFYTSNAMSMHTDI